MKDFIKLFDLNVPVEEHFDYYIAQLAKTPKFSNIYQLIEMFEEAERREAERKALDAVDKLYKENGNELLKLAEVEKEEWERKVRNERILQRYNTYHNLETSGLPHGTPITPEHQQMITLQSMIDAIRCENLNHEFDVVPTADIEDLIERLDEQANEFLKKVKEFKDSADGVV